MKAEILNLLNEDARMSLNDLALRTGATPEQVKEAIAALENEGVIRGYKVILNEKDLGVSKVRALIEVKVTPRREGGFDQVAQRIARYPEVTDLYLISGGFDLLLMVEGDSLQDVASFVSAKLSTIDGVISTQSVSVKGLSPTISNRFRKAESGAFSISSIRWTM